MSDIDPGHPEQPTRRRFCVGACQIASTAVLAALVEACSGSGAGSPTTPSGLTQLTTVFGTAVSGGVSVSVSATPALANVGGAVLVQSSSGFFLLARTGPVRSRP